MPSIYTIRMTTQQKIIAYIFLATSFGFNNFIFSQNTPCSAISLMVNPPDFETYSTNGLSNSGIENPPCGGNISSDIWFEVTSTNTGYLNIVTLANSISDAAMAVYTGPCNNLDFLGCSTDDLCGNSIMPIMHFNDLPPGTTYFIRIWNETGGAGTFDIQVLDAIPIPPMLSLMPVNDAVITGPNCVQLTTTQTGQQGCAWDPTLVDFSQPIDNEFLLNFGTIDGNGADGICLVYQNDPNGLNTCGNQGGGIGSEGIQNSFIVEFDTWDNGGAVNDISQDHVAIDVNGDIDNPINGPFSLGNIEDGLDHTVRFTWDPTTNFYEIFFDGNLVASGNYDIINNCFGGNSMIYCGFTSSTGAAYNNQSVCFAPPTNYPSGIQEFQQVETCESDPYFVGGAPQTTSGIYQDIYSTASGCDSIINTELIVHPTTYSFFQDTICEGECLIFSGETFCSSGPHQITRVNHNNCDSIITLEITILYPVINILPTDVISCDNQDALLDASFSDSGPGFLYQWTGPEEGCITGDNQSNITTAICAGTYELEIFQPLGNSYCTNTQEVEVFIDTIPPQIIIEEAPELSCAVDCIIINANNSTSGNLYIHGWTGPDDFSSTDLNPTVCASGWYYLTIQSLITGCISRDSVEVTIDSESPFADAGNDQELTCTQSVVTLDAQNSSLGNNFTIHWEDLDGNNLGDSPTLQVTESGTYAIEVTSISNGCTERDSVTVSNNMLLPTAIATVDGVLNCAQEPVLLNGIGSISSAPLSFLWQNESGQTIGNDTTVLVEATGNYQLIVNNALNNCADTTNIAVTGNFTPPNATTDPNQFIDCIQTEATLSAANSTGQGGLSYLWLNSTLDSIHSDTEITVSTPGDYTLIILDDANNCRDTAQVNIADHRIYPIADAGLNTLLDCNNPSTQIGGVNTSIGTNFVYTWLNNTNQDIGNTPTLDISTEGVFSLTVRDTTNGCEIQDEVSITADFAQPTAEAGNDQILDCINNSAPLDGGNSSAGMNYTFQWLHEDGWEAGNSAQIDVSSSGIYYLQVTNEDNGCHARDSVQVLQNEDQPIAEIADAPLLDCNTTSLLLDGSHSTSSPSIIYQWTDADDLILGNSNQLNISGAGYYSLEVLDVNNGCKSAANILVGIDTIAPVFTLVDQGIINCYQPTITIGNSALSDSLNWTFEWQDDSNNILETAAILEVDDFGLYHFFVQNENNGCQSNKTVEVTSNFDYPIADAGATSTIDCQNTSQLVGGTNTTLGDDINYQWQNQSGETVSTNPGFSTEISGQYTLFVLNETSGCKDTSDVMIHLDQAKPTVVASVQDILTCTRTSIPLDATLSDSGSNYTINWNSITGGIIQTGDNPLLPTVQAPGRYQLIILNEQNGCADTTQITVEQDINDPIANAGEDFELDCLSPTASLDGSGSLPQNNLSYQWSSSDGTLEGATNIATPVISTPGSYQLLVTDTSNGCTDEATVNITSNFITNFDIQTIQPECFGDLGSINITNIIGGRPPFLYAIDDGDTFVQQAVFSSLAPGNYPVTIQDANGCEALETIAILAPTEVDISLDPQITIRLGETYQLEALTNLTPDKIGTVNWFPPDDLSCDTCLITQAMPHVTSTYQVTVADTNGCSNLASTTIFVDKRPQIFVPNAFSPNGDGNNDKILIFAGIQEKVTIKSFQIYSRWGDIIFEAYDFLPNDPTYGWDGNYRGQTMNPAIFVWYAEIEFQDGRVELFKGDIALIR